ncbi:MAG: T9SS type A sorting domain-containing protein [Bacteroidales bacterium]
MKKFVLLVMVLGMISLLQAQTGNKSIHHPLKKDISALRPAQNAVDVPDHFLVRKANPTVKSAAAVSEATIGTSRYDLQTNQATQNRIFFFPDGTISAVWTMGFSETAFLDRGTGYNYYDNSSWSPEPTARIESVRTGWPSIFPVGAEGEGVVAHDFGTPGGLVLSKRTTKGTGSWTENTIPGPAGQNGLSWPRTVSNGNGYTNLHMIAITRPTGNGGTLYQGLNGALLYNRSTDGGATWNIANQILPGMTSTEYKGFGGDSYSWAEPKDNTLAFVVGDNWTDLFLMKSTDNGSTWTKTVIFQHPYPLFDETTTLVLDTPSVCDGAISVALDNSGKAHVFFGLMRVLNDDLTDGNTSYFPYSDGLAYWNEDMPAFASLNVDTLWNQGHLVGYLQDLNGNDTVMEFDGLATYFMSLTSMPHSCIDASGQIFVVFTSVMEGLSNGTQNYRHIYARASADGGNTWGEFKDLTSSIIHNFHECVFPSVAAKSDNFIHLVYQYDEEPGLAVRGDEDPYGDNTISYMKVPKTDLGVGIEEGNIDLNSVTQNYPNPANGETKVLVNLSKSSTVTVNITNILGQQLKSQNLGFMNQGQHTLNLNLDNLNPGLYFYTVTIGNKEYTNRMIVE